MRKCEHSCLGMKDCPETSECCHTCMYLVNGECVSMGGNYYYPRHFKRMVTG